MAAPGSIAITFEDVTKTFDRPDGSGRFTAVDRISFSINRGEIVAVLGKTGCGKSTIFNLIAGLAEPTSGRITVEGLDPFGEFAALRGKIGIVFQGDRLMPWRTAMDNVLLGLDILGADRKKSEAVAREWLAQARPHRPRERLPARALGRHAPARVHRPRAGGRSGADLVR